MKLPTDRRVLECIFEMYEASYLGASRANDPYVAIDVGAVAKELECSPELLFGRLYYHLDQKYRYRQDNGSVVSLFQIQIGGKRHAVQFPYLSAILAGLNLEQRRILISIGMSADRASLIDRFACCQPDQVVTWRLTTRSTAPCPAASFGTAGTAG
jgi:hypothetical protein